MLTSRSVLLNTPLRSPAVTLHKLLSPHWQQTPASLTHRPTSPTRSRTALTRSAFSTSTSSTSSTSLSPQSFASTKSIRVSKTIYLRPQPRAFTRSIASTPRHARATDSFSSPTSYLRSPHTPTQSAAGTWLSIVLLGLISGGAYLYRSATRSSKTEEEEEEEDELNDPLEAHIKAFVAHHMTGEIMPGRPGTLTPEEDEKLRILWIAVLHVFGVINKEETHALNQNVHGTLPALTRKTTTDSAKEKKEVKRGWFGRHKEESEDLQEDKYGQTAQFKHALANMKPETLRRAFWDMVKHDHPDGLLLRFLRARKWDVEKALVMMVSTMHWRAEEMHVDDDVMLRGEEAMVNQTKSSDAKEARFGEDFLAMMRTGKTYVHGEDKEGRPMCFVRVRLHHAGDQSEASSERYTVYIIETARALLNPPQDTSVSCSFLYKVLQAGLLIDYSASFST